MSDSWTGAWHWLSDDFDGRLLLTETHYCYVFVRKDRTPVDPEQVGDTEAAELVRGIGGSAAGVLTATPEDQLTRLDQTHLVSFDPPQVGSDVQRVISIENDFMVGHVVDEQGAWQTTDRFERLSEAGSGPLAGAWKLESEDWTGMLALTDTEYRYLLTANDRPSVSARDTSDDQAAELFAKTRVEAGSYTLREGQLTLTPDAALNPHDQGKPRVVSINFSGDQLQIEFGDSVSHRFRKIR